MIAWWWLPVAVGGAWLVLLAVGAVLDRELREALGRTLFVVVSLPVAALVALVTWLDVGAMWVSPRAVSRFAAQRSADGRPAWLFWYRGRGVLIIRSWDLGSDRAPAPQLAAEWRKEGA